MTTMRTFVIVTLLAAVAVPAYAQDSASQAQEQARQRAREAAQRVRETEAQRRREQRDLRGGPEFTEPFSRTLRLGRDGSLDLSNVAGDIVVTGGGGDDLKIDAVKRVRQRSEQDARALLQDIQIVVTQRGTQVDVRTENPSRRNWSGGVDYTVSLPNSTNVTLRSVSGDVRVTNVRGELRIDSVSGDVTATSTGRVRWLKTVSGDVQVTDAEGDDVTAGAVSGDVTVRNLKARSIDLELVSGDIRFTGVNCERASLRTISGDIDFAGRLARNGRYQLQSQSGDIQFTPGDDTGFALEASTFNGDIRSDYMLRNTEQTERGPRRGPGRTLRGVSGNSSDAVVILRSFGGDILLSHR